MTKHHSNRLRRSALGVTAALTVAAAGALPASAAPQPTAPQLKLIAASGSVTIDRWKDEPGVYLDLGAYITVDKAPLEFRVTRKSYNDPVVAQQILRQGGTRQARTLPAGLLKDFSGLPGFLEVTLTNTAGTKVLSTSQSFCPNNTAGRVRPDAPATSNWPDGCSGNPFTLGQVWGTEKGWAARLAPDFDSAPVDVPAGEYTAKVSVAKKYRDLFGMTDQPQSIKVTVRETDGGGEGSEHSAHASQPAADGRTTGTGHASGSSALKPNPHRPTGRRGNAAVMPRPDLRAVPAWGIALTDGADGHGVRDAGKEYLAFSATVWNAGPAPLVVDGFRSPGQDKMDAYQYFFDAQGKQVGYTPTGTMEWDPREGHQHWHFSDFAGYRLLGADKKEIVRSGKEAFCLADTDAIDYTVKNANWHPENTDLSTACGEQNSVSVREALDVGNGDTYSQFRPGQSFDVTGLPNGTYYIQVVANPDRKLKETSLTNNVSLRKVILGGTPGARTVTVPAYGLVDAP
ncbi:lysyl oxidase family protein [Streptomyces sp. NPDC047082]|uniref:lysyl oxidase family protein n=1 Tax=Streptomyces sp. NPDC047082 TaxID=3155259 RepID=UPI0033E664DE